MLRLFYAFLIVAIIPACTPPTVPVINVPGPEGSLEVIGNHPQLGQGNTPSDWTIIMDQTDLGASKTQPPLRSTTYQGRPALEFRSGEKHAIAVRHTDALMIVSPYLSWKWNLSDQGPGIHPLRLIVGFKGGPPEHLNLNPITGDLPTHDRAISLVWGDSALRRGSLSLPPPENPLEAPVYTVRGGREHTQKWWSDTVDLASIYAQAWPGDGLRNVRITFIGVAAAPKVPAVKGRITEIRLSH